MPATTYRIQQKQKEDALLSQSLIPSACFFLLVLLFFSYWLSSPVCIGEGTGGGGDRQTTALSGSLLRKIVYGISGCFVSGGLLLFCCFGWLFVHQACNWA